MGNYPPDITLDQARACLLSQLGGYVIMRDPDFARDYFAVDLIAEINIAMKEANLTGESAEEVLRRFLGSDVIQTIWGSDGNPIRSDSGLFNSFEVEIGGVNEEILRILATDPSLIHELSPRGFEELVAEILARLDYEVTLTPRSWDGGIDIFAARKNDLGSFLYLVECKKFSPLRGVGVNVVRSLHGVVEAHTATAGIIVTTSYFTKAAEEFRNRIRHRLSFTDYFLLHQWIKRVTE